MESDPDSSPDPSPTPIPDLDPTPKLDSVLVPALDPESNPNRALKTGSDAVLNIFRKNEAVDRLNDD